MGVEVSVGGGVAGTVVSVEGIVPVGGSGVDVEMETMDSGVPQGDIRIRNRKINNKIMATISLNRS
jgi:hypothetical protein